MIGQVPTYRERYCEICAFLNQEFDDLRLRWLSLSLDDSDYFPVYQRMSEVQRILDICDLWGS